jgi:16S rRNA (guanine527-N7)-methyltransferase
MITPMTAAEFQAIRGVPADTQERLEVYLGVLEKWQGTVNLVGGGSLKDPWRRHFLDSAQLIPLLPPTARVICDIGSGAGFPGLVLAILDQDGGREFHLVESNERKCAFLREASRVAKARAVIHNNRIEKLPGISADLVTARAVAPLAKLIEYAISIVSKHGQCLFLKGKGWREELTEAKKHWIMKESHYSSLSDPTGTILKLEAISRRDQS